MTVETSRIKTKLSNLNALLSDLESQLDPILSKPFPETIIGLELIQQAKLQTVLPYLVYDLIFIYLKAKGTDPKTHAVVAELDRVRQYFDKIAKVESPPIRRTKIDTDAANRFIKQAISGVTSKSNTAISVDAFPQSSKLPVKMMTKMIARAQYERALKKEKDDDEDGLQVHDGHSSDSSTSDVGDTCLTEPISEDMPTSSTSLKRQHTPVDPFAVSHESLGLSHKTKDSTTSSDSDIHKRKKKKTKVIH